MPSSTFSSDFPCHRTPAKNWLAVWSLSLVLAGGAIGGAEAFWRSQGHRPSIVDSPAFWAYHRAQVADNDPNRVVLLGASRIQLGFSTDAFRARFPDLKLTQLAINGQWPLATLRDLAGDERFRGIVICSINPQAYRAEAVDNQAAHVEYYHRQYSSRRAPEVALGAYLQSHLVVLNPSLRLDRVAAAVVRRRAPPTPYYIVTRPDRSRLADYSLIEDLAAHRRQRVEQAKMYMALHGPLSADEWMDEVDVVEGYVRQIQDRGGQVIFVRFPTSGESWDLERQRYPKAEFWDRMAGHTAAITVHFTDVPALQGFDLPDTSHLDQQDAPRFTRALLDHISERYPDVLGP